MAAHISILYDSFRLSKLSTCGEAIEDASMIQPRMRSPTGSLTYYSSIVAIINQHHISSSRSFRPRGKTKEVEENKHRRSIESFADANEIQLLILDPRVCMYVCMCVCVSLHTYSKISAPVCGSWTTTKDTRVKTGTKFTLVDTFSATKSRRLRFRGSPANPNTSGMEWYWLRKWGHRVWFHCAAMVHRSLIARTWALPDPSLLNSPYELSNVDTL